MVKTILMSLEGQTLIREHLSQLPNTVEYNYKETMKLIP